MSTSRTVHNLSRASRVQELVFVLRAGGFGLPLIFAQTYVPAWLLVSGTGVRAMQLR